MVNLLPQQIQRKLARQYYVRLGTVFFLLLAVAIFIGGVLLIPSYFASQNSADSYERYRDALEGAVGLKEREHVSDDIAQLRERVRIMDDYAKSAFTVDFIDALGDKVHTGINVYSISFSRNEGGAEVAIEGEARTRQDLLSFVELLRESAAFTQVTLPVSQLVVDINPSFSIKMNYQKQ